MVLQDVCMLAGLVKILAEFFWLGRIETIDHVVEFQSCTDAGSSASFLHNKNEP